MTTKTKYIVVDAYGWELSFSGSRASQVAKGQGDRFGTKAEAEQARNAAGEQDATVETVEEQ